MQRFKAGKKYEEKVNAFLRNHINGEFVFQQSFEYKSTRDGGWKIKIPDAYLIRPDRIICIEIKLSHCYEAWTSLRGIYQPLLHHYYERPVEVVEICKNFSSGINIPEEVVEITFDDLRNNRFPQGGGRYHLILGDL